MKAILCLSPSFIKRTIDVHRHTSYIYERVGNEENQFRKPHIKIKLKSCIGRNYIGGYFDQ